MAGKSTRMTVDLGSEELVKCLKIAAVEHRRTVRDIVVEALTVWLTAHSPSDVRKADRAPQPRPAREVAASPEEKDYVSMMETLNRYRGVGGA